MSLLFPQDLDVYVAASAYYETPPEYIDNRTIDQLADEPVKEVMEGFEGLDIKSGIIGEMVTTG